MSWKTLGLVLIDHFLGDDTNSRSGMPISERIFGTSGTSAPGKYFSVSIDCSREDELPYLDQFGPVNTSTVTTNCRHCGAMFTFSTPGNGKDGTGYRPDSNHRITYSNIKMVR